jgi:hypothetical protein
VDLLEGQTRRIWPYERAEVDSSADLKNGKVALAVTLMSLGAKTSRLQSAEGMATSAAMHGWREEKVMIMLWCFVF